MLRAYEVYEATGRPLAEWQSAPAAPVLKDAAIAAFVLDPPRDRLRAQIAARFEAMVDGGGLAEAATLGGLDPTLPAAKLLGLRPLQALAAGTLARPEALDAAITATRQFAKRQMTWFRHRMAHYSWYDPLQSNIITQYKNIQNFEWYNLNGVLVGKGAKLTGVGSGSYYAKCFNGNCTIRSASYTLSDIQLVVNDQNKNVSFPTCTTAGSITGLTVNNNAGVVYSWKDDNNREVGTALDVTGLTGGNYTLTITDAVNNCNVVYGPVLIQPATTAPFINQTNFT
ncbi:MAG: hypothetical protein EOP02_29930, partial [Proteobacteria bacterium]